MSKFGPTTLYSDGKPIAEIEGGTFTILDVPGDAAPDIVEVDATMAVAAQHVQAMGGAADPKYQRDPKPCISCGNTKYDTFKLPTTHRHGNDHICADCISRVVKEKKVTSDKWVIAMQPNGRLVRIHNRMDGSSLKVPSAMLGIIPPPIEKKEEPPLPSPTPKAGVQLPPSFDDYDEDGIDPESLPECHSCGDEMENGPVCDTCGHDNTYPPPPEPERERPLTEEQKLILRAQIEEADQAFADAKCEVDYSGFDPEADEEKPAPTLRCDDAIAELHKRALPVASGEMLDRIAESHGVTRFDGETDEEVRERILGVVGEP